MPFIWNFRLKKRQLSLLFFLCSSLVACTPSQRAAKYPSSYSFDAKPSSKKAVFLPIWSKGGDELEPFGAYAHEYAGVGHIAGSDSVVVPKANGRVLRYRAANGELAWEVTFPYSFSVSPLSSNNLLFLPTLEGRLLAVTEGDGSLVWNGKADHSLEGPVAANREVVVGLDAEDVLYCWDATNGSERWRFANERNNNFTIKGTATPIIQGNSVVVGFADGRVAKFALATGALEWSLDLSGGESEFADVDWLLPAPGKKDLIYAAGRASGVYAIDSKNGRVLWKNPIKGISAFAQNQKELVVGTTSDQVIAVSRQGKTLWRFNTTNGTPTSLSSYNQYVVVATGQGSLYILDGVNGYPMDKWVGESGIHAPLTYASERIYMQSDAGNVYTFKLGW